jgi:hypothetical protein
MLSLHFQKAGHCCLQAESLRVRRINSANHRLRHSLKGFGPEASAHKLGQAFVGVVTIYVAARQEQIERHSRFA